jgi:hypothetical protein
MMEFNILTITYHITGILIAIFFLFIANIFRKEKEGVIRSRIFLRYNHFRITFYIATIGAVVFAIGNIMALLSMKGLVGAILHELHKVGEVIYNLCMMIFVFLFFSIMRAEKRL